MVMVMTSGATEEMDEARTAGEGAQIAGAAPLVRRDHGLSWRLRKLRNAAGRRLGTRFGAVAIRALARSWERTELGSEHRLQAERDHPGLLVAIWHGRGVVGAAFYDPRSCQVLVSASEDGSMATTILGRLGYAIIRGSSSRGGVRALREMITCLKGGQHVGITPDGPRGPLHSMSPGLVFLSRATGAPVLPFGMAMDRAWRLNTWDDYCIPKPRARVVAVYRPVIQVPRDADNETLQEYSDRIRESLIDAELEGFAHLGLEPDWEDETDETAGRESSA